MKPTSATAAVAARIFHTRSSVRATTGEVADGPVVGAMGSSVERSMETCGPGARLAPGADYFVTLDRGPRWRR
jgi:hypothetical protein